MHKFGTIEPGIEYEARPGGYAIVVNDGRVALVKTPRGVFLPGGGVEDAESPAEAALRETKEETGLIVEIVGEIGTAEEFVHSPKYSAHFQKVCTFFSARGVSRTNEREPDHELIWTTPEETVDLLDHGSQKWAVCELFGMSVLL